MASILDYSPSAAQLHHDSSDEEQKVTCEQDGIDVATNDPVSLMHQIQELTFPSPDSVDEVKVSPEELLASADRSTVSPSFPSSWDFVDNPSEAFMNPSVISDPTDILSYPQITSITVPDLSSSLPIFPGTSYIEDEGTNAELDESDALAGIPVSMPPQKQQCNMCQKQISCKTFKQHMKRHNSFSIFACVCCGRNFQKESLLNKHLLTHTGKKSYKCDVCGRCFPRSMNLKRHKLIHNENKANTCALCGKHFNLAAALRRHHLIIHSGKNQLGCNVCGKSFLKPGSLKKHVKTHFKGSQSVDQSDDENGDGSILNRAQPPSIIPEFQDGSEAFTDQSHQLYNNTDDDQPVSYESLLAMSESDDKNDKKPKQLSTEAMDLDTVQSSTLLVKSEPSSEGLGEDIENIDALKLNHMQKELFDNPTSQPATSSMTFDRTSSPSLIGTIKLEPTSEECWEEENHASEDTINKQKFCANIQPNLVIHRASFLDTMVSNPEVWNDAQSSISDGIGADSLSNYEQKPSPEVLNDVRKRKTSKKSKLKRNVRAKRTIAEVADSLFKPARRITSKGKKNVVKSKTKDALDATDVLKTPVQKNKSKVKDKIPKKKTGKRNLKQVKADKEDVLSDSATDVSDSYPAKRKKQTMKKRKKVVRKRPTKDKPDNEMEEKNASAQNDPLSEHSKSPMIQEKKPPVKCSVCNKEIRWRYMKEHMRIHAGDVIHICSYCGKSFTQSAYLKNHIRTHTGEKPYKCTTCGRCFCFKSGLRVHKRVHTGERPYKCETCGKGFTQIGQLKKHRMLHTGERPFQCVVCDKKYTNAGSLRTHEKLHTLGHLKCDVCGETFIQTSDLELHEKKHEGEDPHKCDICGKEYRSLQSLKDHGKLHREKKFECETCGKKFILESALNHHKRNHTGEKPFSCDRCGKTFAQLGSLSRHKLQYTREKSDEIYECDICNKKFKHPRSINRHMRIHTGEQPFKCDICEKTFTWSNTLIAHKRTHTGETFVCEFCGKEYLRPYPLQEHKRLHTGELPYQCKVCNKKFTRASYLNEHKSVHIEEAEKFKCKFCNRKFNRARKLNSHVKLVHMLDQQFTVTN